MAEADVSALLMKVKKNLLACEELQRYDRARIFLDEDYTAADRFTALGNLYFIHEDIDNALIWDFVDCKFVAVEGREVLSGNIENVPLKEKAKFPQHFFPEFKWSRKGFLRTRWSINNCIFDLVNIHLFHDASNIVAMESSPSLYCGNRRRALLHTLQRFENDQYSKVPLFIFGDFNFRLDSCLLIKALTTKAVKEQTYGKKDQVNKVVYTEEGNGKVVLTVESKSFDFHDKHADLFSNTIKWLLQYDTELSSFQDRLCEHEITFPPSYPFTEEVSDGFSYMKTRVPSWCDRILLSHSAKDIISHESCSKPEYDIIGRDTCMGDHKPVYLFLRIKPGKGKDLEDNMFEFHHVKPFARRRGLSINGELVPDSEFDSLNIHDFAVFEKEQELIPEFRVSIKSRSSEPSEDKQTSSEKLSGGVDGANETSCSKAPGPSIAGLEHSRSFQQIAHKVCVVERVLLRWPRRPRSRHHSSSSEDFYEETLEDSNNSDEYQQGINSEADLVAVDSVHLHLLSHDICTKEETHCEPTCCCSRACGSPGRDGETEGDSQWPVLLSDSPVPLYTTLTCVALNPVVLLLWPSPTPKAELSPLPGTSDIIIPSTQVKISEVDTTRYIHIRQGQSSTRVFRETSYIQVPRYIFRFSTADSQALECITYI
ncbi:hypothetical protein C0Q70_09352 [Pomacea canaliculata]|uniref:inositol-polyphosphate 5-phosphatase n=1 Tax=Pomacea canaliculata TaxID=400727 RepID=A0A2T7P9K7_POMCA|nr:hypothetical protein C0Q70_09352 [Pomacea canaliculata]